jgi:hypothetical protein
MTRTISTASDCALNCRFDLSSCRYWLCAMATDALSPALKAVSQDREVSRALSLRRGR